MASIAVEMKSVCPVHGPGTEGRKTNAWSNGRMNTSCKQWEREDQATQKRKMYREIFKMLVFVFFCVGCFYQVSKYLIVYFQYPILVDVRVENREKIQPPGLTFCNNNGVHRTRYCAMNPDKCESPDNIDELCQKHPAFCQALGNFSSMDDLQIPKEVKKPRTFQEFQVFAIRAKETIPLCVFFTSNLAAQICEVNHFIISNMMDSMEGGCYTLNMRTTNSSQNLPFMSTRTAPLPSIAALIDFMPHEYSRPNFQVEGRFNIHSPYSIDNPSLYGRDILPGRIYMVKINPIEKFLLESPYPTHCIDYVKQWKKNNYAGPLSMESCVAECFIEKQYKDIKCVYRGNFYPHNYSLCEKHIPFNDTSCFHSCNRPCYSLEYEYEIEEHQIGAYTQNNIKQLTKSLGFINYSLPQLRMRFSSVAIYIRKPEVLIYKYSPKFEMIEIFSYLGGYIGMWLGLSLLGLYDALVSAIVSWRDKREKKRLAVHQKTKTLTKSVKLPRTWMDESIYRP